MWSNGNSNWVHQSLTSEQVDTSQAKPIADLWNSLGVYSGTYRPDFVVFDKYERDAFDAYGIGYLWNQRALNNYMEMVRLVSIRLSDAPVMLWQIPGGHLQAASSDPDTRTSNASTECDYFFGNSLLAADQSNMKQYILNTLLPQAIYGTTSVQTYLTRDGQDWSVGHMNTARNARVFAILWGGGSTTSVGVYPTNDGGWLADRIKEFFQDPVMVLD